MLAIKTAPIQFIRTETLRSRIELKKKDKGKN